MAIPVLARNGKIIGAAAGGTNIDSITYEEYQAMSDEDKAKFVGTVTDYPIEGGGSGGTALIKKFEYTGTGQERFIEMPEIPSVILGIYDQHITSNVRTSLKAFIWGENTVLNTYEGGNTPQVWSITYDGDKKFKINGVNQIASQNAEGERYTVHYISDSGSSGGSGKGGIDYSTEEQDTGLKWIDGRTVYQKSYTGVLRDNFLTEVEQNFSHTVIEGTVVAYAPSGQFLSNGLIAGVGEWALAVHKSDRGALSITSGSATYNGVYYLTVRYVKEG